MANRKKISKGWFIFHVVATICTSGLWLIPLGIYALMKCTQNR